MTDGASLHAAVNAKIVRDRDITCRSVLVERFTRVRGTIQGNDDDTRVADLIARQMTNPSALLQRIHTELDTLERCRNGSG